MANIIDYIKWRGDLSFSIETINVVDSLILSRLSYIDFDDIHDEGEELQEISQRYIGSETKMNPGILLKEGTKELLYEVSQSERFKVIVVKEFEYKLDEANQLQFSAVIFEIDKDSAYVAFRGTDDTLVGWKEDFNMTFMDVIPAQQEALAYLEKVIDEYDYCNIYVGGHSKGGNLAVYAASCLKEEFQPLVKAVYSNDGPGFKESIIESEGYKVMMDRIVALVPQSSVVGLMLQTHDKFRVVKSNQLGIMQHDCLSWEVLGKDFIYLPDLYNDAKIVNIAIKKMMEKISIEERIAFVTVLFDLLSVNDNKTLTDLSKGGIGNFLKISSDYRNLDKKTKEAISEPLNLFLDEINKSFIEVNELNQLRSRLKEWRHKKHTEFIEFLRD